MNNENVSRLKFEIKSEDGKESFVISEIINKGKDARTPRMKFLFNCSYEKKSVQNFNFTSYKEDFSNWLYGFFSIGVDRQNALSLTSEEGYVLTLTIINGTQCQFSVASADVNFSFIVDKMYMRSFQATMLRVINML